MNFNSKMNYPSNVAELRVWAIEAALPELKKAVTVGDAKIAITVAGMLESYVNSDDVFSSTTDSLADSQSDFLQAMNSALAVLMSRIAAPDTQAATTEAAQSCVGCATKARKGKGKKATTETEVVDSTTETENVIELNEEV